MKKSLILLFILVITFFPVMHFAQSTADTALQQEAIQKIKILSGKELTAAEIDKYLKEQMDTLNVKGISIAIINDGKVVYHRARGLANINSSETVDDQTLFESGSLAKPVFAYFVMKMVEKGLLNLDTPLYQYLPYPDIENDLHYKLITARMVLCHTTGFPNWRSSNPDGKLDIKFTPGTKFSYSGEGYKYLSMVIAHLTGRDLSNLDSLFQQEITKPLNIEHAHFGINTYVAKHLAGGHMGNEIVNDKSWDKMIFQSAMGLYTNANNYANFLIAIMENKGLEKGSFGEMLKEQVQLPEDNSERKFSGAAEWGLGFGRKPSIYGINYIHEGTTWGYTSSFMFNKEKKFGYVFFTNSNSLGELIHRMEVFLIDGK